MYFSCLIIIIIKGHSLRRACLQPATNTQNFSCLMWGICNTSAYFSCMAYLQSSPVQPSGTLISIALRLSFSPDRRCIGEIFPCFRQPRLRWRSPHTPRPPCPESPGRSPGLSSCGVGGVATAQQRPTSARASPAASLGAMMCTVHESRNVIHIIHYYVTVYRYNNYTLFRPRARDDVIMVL